LSPYLQVVPGGGTEAVSQKLEDSSDVLGGACSLWQSKHQQSTAGNSGLTLDQIRLKQLQEVEKIKRTLGHHNRPCNAAVLERALVMPQQKLKKNVGLYNALPRLLINPFYEGEVKKKKGKKKRGKSKKPKWAWSMTQVISGCNVVIAGIVGHCIEHGKHVKRDSKLTTLSLRTRTASTSASWIHLLQLLYSPAWPCWFSTMSVITCSHTDVVVHIHKCGSAVGTVLRLLLHE